MKLVLLLSAVVVICLIKGSDAAGYANYTLCAEACAYPKCCNTVSMGGPTQQCIVPYTGQYTSLNVTNRACMTCQTINGVNKTFLSFTGSAVGNESLGGNCPYTCKVAGSYNSTSTSECLWAEPGWYSPANNNSKYRCSSYPLNYSCNFNTSGWASPDCPFSCNTYTFTPTETKTVFVTPTSSVSASMVSTETITHTTSYTPLVGPSITAIADGPLVTGPISVTFSDATGLLSPRDQVCWTPYGTTCRSCNEAVLVGTAALSQPFSVVMNFTSAGRVDICYLFDVYGLWSVGGNFSVQASYAFNVDYMFPCDSVTLTIHGHNLTDSYYELARTEETCGNRGGILVDDNGVFGMTASIQTSATEEGINKICIRGAALGKWEIVGLPFQVYTPIFPIDGLAPKSANDVDYDVKGSCQNGIEVCQDDGTAFGLQPTCYCICHPGFCGRFCCSSCL